MVCGTWRSGQRCGGSRVDLPFELRNEIRTLCKGLHNIVNKTGCPANAPIVRPNQTIYNSLNDCYKRKSRKKGSCKLTTPPTLCPRLLPFTPLDDFTPPNRSPNFHQIIQILLLRNLERIHHLVPSILPPNPPSRPDDRSRLLGIVAPEGGPGSPVARPGILFWPLVGEDVVVACDAKTVCVATGGVCS